MKVLEVIHGYPPLYNAGSEVYTQIISRGLVQMGHEVSVFTREEDPYRADFDVRQELDLQEPSIKVYLANHARSRDRYRHTGMDDAFSNVLSKEKSDVVHIGHLNHLSTGIPEIASNAGALVVYTFHDFWLSCPRGQFMQMGLGESEIWKVCQGQDNHRCAVHCLSRMWGGVPDKVEEDISQWITWVENRMQEIRHQMKYIDLFIAPSNHIRERMIAELDIDPQKVVFEPYGFDTSRLIGRQRIMGKDLVFGYIGRISPSKGVDILLKAFGKTTGDARLYICGRETYPDTPALRRIEEGLIDNRRDRVEWLPEYRNEDIVTSVFNNVDVIVVPSIWDENSPLVIHEAQQVGIPVITADHGGMKELVTQNVNGFLFRHRDVVDLTKRLQDAIDDPKHIESLGKIGYIHSDDGCIPDIEGHVTFMTELFEEHLVRKDTGMDNLKLNHTYGGESEDGCNSCPRSVENYI